MANGRPTKADYDAVAGDFAKVFGDIDRAYRTARAADTGEEVPPGLVSGAALRLEMAARKAPAPAGLCTCGEAASAHFDDHSPTCAAGWPAQPTTPAGRLAYEAELRQMLADAEARPRSLWRRLSDAWAGFVAGWRGER